jgi:transposase
VIETARIEELNTRQVRALALQMQQALLAKDEQLDAHRVQLETQQRQLVHKQATIDKLTHEMAVLKRLKFAARSEAFNAEQKSLLEEAVDADLEALSRELARERPAAPSAAAKEQPKRQTLPASLPRREIRHEPEATVCGCGCAMKRIGEDVAEKLDYVPGVFTVERHIRGKWVCAQCETLVQAPVPAHVIDKGLPTTGLLAQVLVAKYADHLPLYRQEAIFERAGMNLSRSTLAQWVGACGVQLQPLVDALKAALLTRAVLHADETPVPMLKPGSGKTHRAYLWSYGTTAFDPIKGVVFDFAETRAGRHVQAFLGTDRANGSSNGSNDSGNDSGTGGWRGTLVCDDYAGYKALFGGQIVEAGCLAHARRKFFDLWANHQSAVAEQALGYFRDLYAVEREVQDLQVDERRRIRQLKAKPVADALQAWLVTQRQKVPEGSATAKAIDYSLNRWTALTRYLGDGNLPADNNWIENRLRPIALRRANWLFAGSLRAGQRAAAIMSLIGSAKMNDLDPYVYLKDVLERLPTHPARRIEELLPHRWRSTTPH